jgi:hypothetical protein
VVALGHCVQIQPETQPEIRPEIRPEIQPEIQNAANDAVAWAAFARDAVFYLFLGS